MNEIITAIDNLVDIFQKVIDITAECVLDHQPEDLIGDIEQITASAIISPHTDTENDSRFQEALTSLTTLMSKAILPMQELGRYSEIPNESGARVGAFTPSKIISLKNKLFAWDHQFAIAERLAQDYGSGGISEENSNATNVIRAMKNACNEMASAINTAIKKHNLLFKGMDEYQVDLVKFFK